MHLYLVVFGKLVLGLSRPTQPLPNWIDPSRETVQQVTTAIPESFVPPPSNFRVPAEYEPTKTVILGWSGFQNLLTGIAQATINFGNATVWAVKGPASIRGVESQKYRPIALNIDTVWMRDYGPVGIDQAGTVGIVDTVYRHFQFRVNDDQLPSRLAQANNFSSYQLPVILDELIFGTLI
jgi:agmatine/peptidylarginine deiminase